MAHKVIRRRTPIELMEAVYAAEGWERAEGESRTARVRELYDLTVDHRTDFYVATPKRDTSHDR